MKKIKSKVDVPEPNKPGEYRVRKGDVGKITDEWKSSEDGRRMRAVTFKNGYYGVYGDTAFDMLLEFVK